MELQSGTCTDTPFMSYSANRSLCSIIQHRPTETVECCFTREEALNHAQQMYIGIRTSQYNPYRLYEACTVYAEGDDEAGEICIVWQPVNYHVN